MQLVKFERGESNGEGFLEDGILHLAGEWRAGRAADAPFNLSRAGRSALLEARDRSTVRVPLSEVRLAAPVDPRAKIICVGLNYRAHAEEVASDLPPQPALFLKDRSTLVRPGEALRLPDVSETFDYEGELAVVIGRRAHAVSRSEAASAVGAYCCFMDGSVREFQQHSISAGKNFWRSSSMGPWLTTADAVEDASSIELRTLVNGEERQHTHVSMMLYDIAAIVAYCSLWTVLEPGDVIATGTPAGVGAGSKPPRWLKHGDQVEVAISGVGSLTNPVSRESGDVDDIVTM